MYKKILYTLALLLAVGLVLPVFAAPDRGVHSDTFTLPDAADGAHVISLGTAKDPATGKKVEGYAFVYYKKGYHHRPGHSGGPGGNKGGGNDGDTTSSCYAFLAKDAKWKQVEPFMVDTASASDISGLTMADLMDTAVAKWNAEAPTTVFDGQVDYATNGGDGADTSAPDDKNEVLFASIDSPGAIAVTTVWGIFNGPPFQRELVEWDMVFDDVDFDWSAEQDGVPGKMDFLNIAAHEVGHAAGLGHPSDTCTEETMYRFADEGETKKRDLEAGDVAGVNELY